MNSRELRRWSELLSHDGGGNGMGRWEGPREARECALAAGEAHREKIETLSDMILDELKPPSRASQRDDQRFAQMRRENEEEMWREAHRGHRRLCRALRDGAALPELREVVAAESMVMHHMSQTYAMQHLREKECRDAELERQTKRLSRMQSVMEQFRQREEAHHRFLSTSAEAATCHMTAHATAVKDLAVAAFNARAQLLVHERELRQLSLNATLQARQADHMDVGQRLEALHARQILAYQRTEAEMQQASLQRQNRATNDREVVHQSLMRERQEAELRLTRDQMEFGQLQQMLQTLLGAAMAAATAGGS